MKRKKEISLGMRLLLVMISIPGVFIITTHVVLIIFFNNATEIDLFSIIYGVLSMYVLYISLSGRSPIT